MDAPSFPAFALPSSADAAEALFDGVVPFRPPTAVDDRRPPGRLRCRTAFISDTHLGFEGARAGELVAVLRRLDCDKLYLVGDIIDMWQLRRRWRWSSACAEAIQIILDMARRGVEVILVPGNHDEAARAYAGVDVGGVDIRLLDVHETADGRRLLVTHGDQYDLVVKHSKLLCLLGDMAYVWLIRLNRGYNAMRRAFGFSYWSLAQYVKLKVKSACTYISTFEETLVHEAARRGLDGVVCGHIHKAEDARVDGLGYFNCGDWVESCTLVTEDDHGHLRVVDGMAWLEAAEAEANPAAELRSA
ncbi:MAG: UDP-2,3-diacylglucosamine diphosphatase [Acidobacteriota bacterium]